MGLLDGLKKNKICANCGNKVRFPKRLDSGVIICNGCSGLNNFFGGGCPICKKDFSLYKISFEDIICKNCDAKFRVVGFRKYKLIEGNSEYLNIPFPVADWERIRNGETLKIFICPGCNWVIEEKLKEGSDVECTYCGRKLWVESDQLVEVEPSDEIADSPTYKVILHSKSIRCPPCCSICLGPAEKFKDRVDSYSLELIVYYSSKILTLPSIPYCRSCYHKVNKFISFEQEGISISKQSNPDEGIMVLKFRNQHYAKMFRELNGC